jgi:iron complex outermembrane receptor protein
MKKVLCGTEDIVANSRTIIKINTMVLFIIQATKNNQGVVISVLNKSWGYSHLNFSVYRLEIELPEGERDSTGAFIKPVVVNDSTIEDAEPTDADFHSYSTRTPHQLIRHYKVGWMNNFYLNDSKL